MNRVHISQVTDAPELVKQVSNEGPTLSDAGDESITEMKDMQAMRIMLGFDGTDFDGMGREADSLYQWAISESGPGPDALMRIKALMMSMGDRSTGKEMMRKLAMWTSLDRQKKEILKRQMAL